MERHLVNLAIGRIFGLVSRPYQDGDIAQYERCRSVILDHTGSAYHDRAPNYARDRMKGAQGD